MYTGDAACPRPHPAPASGTKAPGPARIGPIPSAFGETLAHAREIAAELLWSSRCVVCDRPGPVLCAACRAELAYIDRWQACPRCGAPYGRLVCTECNAFALRQRGLSALSFQRCASAVAHDEAARRIVTAYKDAGERRLAPVIAELCAAQIGPGSATAQTVLTYIPASAAARRRRGFDHIQEIAHALAHRTGLRCTGLFARPDGRDQRGQDRAARMANMEGRLTVLPGHADQLPEKIIVFDDVCTTGATLVSAASALTQAGCRQVFCLTFSRVP